MSRIVTRPRDHFWMNLSVAVICGSSFGMNGPGADPDGQRREETHGPIIEPRAAARPQNRLKPASAVVSRSRRPRAPVMASCSSGLSCWSEVHPLTFLA